MTMATASAPRSRRPDVMYKLAFFLVEVFAALEVTAALVATPRIGRAFDLPEAYDSWIITAYLYPMIAGAVLFLLLNRPVQRVISSRTFFLIGLAVFALGNACCFLADQASVFFAGRVVQGLGAAMAFAGQLWTAGDYHRSRIVEVLFWGEFGGALGVMAGPLVGGVLTQWTDDGWRYVFALLGTLSLLTLVVGAAALNRIPPPAAAVAPGGDRGTTAFGRLFYLLVVSQIAVSSLAVGAEYLFSDYLQLRLGKSALFVGGMTLIASLGIVVGSYLVSTQAAGFARQTQRALVGLLLSLAILTALLTFNLLAICAAPIFGLGLAMGWANVAIYGAIAEDVNAENFLASSLIYLLAMQMGNGLGVQIESWAENAHGDVIWITAALMILPLLLLAAFRWAGPGLFSKADATA